VYKTVPGSGQLTTIYAFGSTPEEASNPMFPLAEGNDGNMLYRITPLGTETVLIPRPFDAARHRRVIDRFSAFRSPGTDWDRSSSRVPCRMHRVPRKLHRRL